MLRFALSSYVLRNVTFCGPTKVSNACSRKNGILNKLKHVLSVEIKNLLYNSFILPHINYCITAWGFQPGRILKLQKKTVIIITLSKYNSHSDPIFKRLHFLKVDDLFTLQQLKLYYNYSHNDVPIYFQNWELIPNCNVHKHDTRNKHELYTYRVKHEYAKKCLRHNLPLILKARRGSGFYEMFCIFANMSCLCIHLVTLFNFPCKKKIVMEFFFLGRKISFFHHPTVFISVK